MLTWEKEGGKIKKQKEEINASCNPATWDHDSVQLGAFLPILRTSGPGGTHTRVRAQTFPGCGTWLNLPGSLPLTMCRVLMRTQRESGLKLPAQNLAEKRQPIVCSYHLQQIFFTKQIIDITGFVPCFYLLYIVSILPVLGGWKHFWVTQVTTGFFF